MTTRHFTVAEARALLPELDGVFQELAALRTELERHTDRIKILDALWGPAVRETGNPDRDEFLRERSAARTVIRKMDRLVKDRILARGIRFPQGGLEHGLVDFPTRLEGRTVYLCWRWGEEEIANWHEVDGGYAGRHPLTDDVAEEMKGDSTAD